MNIGPCKCSEFMQKHNNMTLKLYYKLETQLFKFAIIWIANPEQLNDLSIIVCANKPRTKISKKTHL